MFVPPLGALDSLAASMGKSQAYSDYFRITRRPPMIRTTTTYRYNLDGNITQRVVEEEEVAADVSTPPQPAKTLVSPWLKAEPDTVRSTYRELSQPEKNALAAVKAAGQAFIDSLHAYVVEGREKSLALTNAEQSVMWATKSITT